MKELLCESADAHIFFANPDILCLADRFDGRDLNCPNSRNPGGDQSRNQADNGSEEKSGNGDFQPHLYARRGQEREGITEQPESDADSDTAYQRAERNTDGAEQERLIEDGMANLFPCRSDGLQNTELSCPLTDRDGEGIVDQRDGAKGDQKNQDSHQSVEHLRQSAVPEGAAVDQEIAVIGAFIGDILRVHNRVIAGRMRDRKEEIIAAGSAADRKRRVAGTVDRLDGVIRAVIDADDGIGLFCGINNSLDYFLRHRKCWRKARSDPHGRSGVQDPA